MDIVVGPLIELILMVIHLYIWVLVISAVASWLVAFNVVNTHNRVVYTVMDVLYRLTEPVLAPVRRMLPNMGGMDLSPIAVILALYFVQGMLVRLAIRLAV